MEKTVIRHLQQVIPNVIRIMQNEDSMKFHYDREVDVLYITFGDKKAVDSDMVSDDVIVRRDKESNIVGLTVMHASTL